VLDSNKRFAALVDLKRSVSDAIVRQNSGVTLGDTILQDRSSSKDSSVQETLQAAWSRSKRPRTSAAPHDGDAEQEAGTPSKTARTSKNPWDNFNLMCSAVATRFQGTEQSAAQPVTPIRNCHKGSHHYASVTSQRTGKTKLFCTVCADVKDLDSDHSE
jgi:hypothetical protein